MRPNSFLNRRSLHVFCLYLSLFIITGCSGNHKLKSPVSAVKKDFNNQGNQEDYWAGELFDRDYKIEHYKKHKRHVVINGDNYEFKGMVVTVGPFPALRAIFNEGLFYPGV